MEERPSVTKQGCAGGTGQVSSTDLLKVRPKKVIAADFRLNMSVAICGSGCCLYSIRWVADAVLEQSLENYFRDMGKATDESFLCVSFCYTASSPARRAAIISRSWVKSLISEEKSLYFKSRERRWQGVTACYLGVVLLFEPDVAVRWSRLKCQTCLQLCFVHLFFFEICLENMTLVIKALPLIGQPDSGVANQALETHSGRTPESKVRIILIYIEWHILINKNHRMFMPL